MDRVEPYLDSMQAQTADHDPWPSSERRDSFDDDEILIRQQGDRRIYNVPPKSRVSRSRSLSASSSASGTSKYEPEEPQVEADIVYTLAIRRRFDERSPRRVVVDEQMRQDVPFDIPLCVESPEKPQSGFNSRTNLPPRSRRSSKILEVLTKVLDSRYSSREMSKIRRLKISPPPPMSELRLSRIARRLVLIHSDYLKEILGSLVKYYPEAAYWQSTPPVEIEEPFHVLMHHYSEIQSWIEANEEQSGQQEDNAEDRAAQLKHMRVLHGFLRDGYEDKILPTLALLTVTTPTINFEMLWFLFRPGIDVYLQTSEGVSAAVVYKVERDIITIDRPYRRWYVKCWRMASNGSRVGRVTCTGVITRYDGCREVTSLPVCPTGIWDTHDSGSRRAKIMQRNKISLEALQKGSLHVQYDGPDLSDGRHYSGKVVIDHSRAWNSDGEISTHTPIFDQVQDFSNKFAAYDRIFINNDNAKNPTKQGKLPSATITADRWSSAATAGASATVGTGASMEPWEDVDEDNQSNTLTDHQLFLLQPEALAFALSAKDWMYISMDYVRLLQPSPDSIDNLVLVDPHALETIQALSMKQISASRSWSADFIEGKGTGQIILLHGPPGVGKTYTVESIAAWLQRPLLALTVADIGTKEVKVEQELLKWFDIAESWNAVLLVDEADIFLEQRKTRDLARNGLVSAFLRRMEYFSGLLFLTTNRVGQIDDAFMSRVHVAIGYEGLTPDARRKIWSGFFKKLKKEKGDKVYIGKNAQEYVLDSEEVRKIDLNGREIRNALQTALTLAEYDNVGENKDFVIIEEGHFKKVLGMADKFHKYVGSIRRENEAKRAQGRGDRNDFGMDDNS